jgi:4a-hydroxytetrahydrobiopterin dehydratase
MSAAQPLANAVVDEALLALPGWKREDAGLRKRYRRASFPAAIAFVTRVADVAEAAQHHPDIDIRWRTVIVYLTTHEAGGVTEHDLALAREIEEVAAEGE